VSGLRTGRQRGVEVSPAASTEGWTRRRFAGMLSLASLLAVLSLAGAGGARRPAAARTPPLRPWDEQAVASTGRWAG